METIIKQIFIYFCAETFSVMAFMTCLYKDWIPAMLLFFVVTAVITVKSGVVFNHALDKAWQERRNISKTLTEVKGDYEKISQLLDAASSAEKPDKPIPDRNIRPGSRQSAKYRHMVEERGEKNDDRG